MPASPVSPSHPPADNPAGPLASPEPWDMVSDAYAERFLSQFERFSRDALRLADLPPGAEVVDVATGPGTLAMMAAAAGSRVCALDFSPLMLANLEKRLASRGPLPVEAIQGDGQALPYASDRFDGAFSMFGLMFFPDRGAGFRELRRVLRPGGRAVVSSWAAFDGPFALMQEALRAQLPWLPPPRPLPLSDPDGFEAEMRQAGFHPVAIHAVAHPAPSASLAEFWGDIQVATAPVVLLRRKLGEEKWGEVAAGVYRYMAERLGEGPVVGAGTAYLGVGRK